MKLWQSSKKNRSWSWQVYTCPCFKRIITWKKKKKKLKIWVQIINVQGNSSNFDFINLPTRSNFHTDIWDSPLLFKNDILIDSPTNLCLTFAWPPRYYHTSDFPRNSGSVGPLLICGKSFQLRYVGESIRTSFVKSNEESQISMLKNFNV